MAVIISGIIKILNIGCSRQAHSIVVKAYTTDTERESRRTILCHTVRHIFAILWSVTMRFGMSIGLEPHILDNIVVSPGLFKGNFCPAWEIYVVNSLLFSCGSRYIKNWGRRSLLLLRTIFITFWTIWPLLPSSPFISAGGRELWKCLITTL